MGYYSSFEFELDDESFTDAFVLALEEVSGYLFYSSGAGTIDPGDVIKWYDHDSHITTVSEALPQVGFTFERVGEEAPDAERYHMQNGVKTNEQKMGWVST